MKRTVAVLACVALVGLAAACSRSDDPRAGEARLELHGVATITGDGTRTVEGGDHDLVDGDVVHVERGTATVLLPGGATLELRDRGRTGSKVEIGAVPALLAGDLLAQTGDDGLRIDAGAAEIAVDGAARLTRSLSVASAVYRGRAEVDSGGRSLTVPALRQVVVADARLVPREPDPLAYEEDDEWDVRFLDEAMDVSRSLDALSRGAEANVVGERTSAAFYRELLPGLSDERRFTQSLLDGTDRSIGETVIGTAIALLGADDSFPERFEEVFDFREAGAAWGLVALDQRVEGDDLLGLVRQAIGNTTLAVAAPATGGGASTDVALGPVGSGGGGAAPGGGSSPGGSSPGGSTPPPTSPPPSSPPPTSPPPTSPPTTVLPPVDPDEPIPDAPSPVGDILEPVTGPVNDVLGDILGGEPPDGDRTTASPADGGRGVGGSDG